MDQQREIDWDELRIRQHLLECGGFEASDIELVVLLWRKGHKRRVEIAGEEEDVIEWESSLRQAARDLRIGSHHTVNAAAERLRGRGLLTSMRPARGVLRFCLRWSAIRQLDPQESWAMLGARGRARARAGALGRAYIREIDVSDVRVPCSCVNVNIKKDTEYTEDTEYTVGAPARAHGCPGAPKGAQAAMDWRPVTSEDLCHWVRRKDLAQVRRMYEEALLLGWIPCDCEDNRLKFLTIVHHAVFARGVRSPMAILVTRVKAGLDVSRIAAKHEQWAAKMLTRSGRAVDGVRTAAAPEQPRGEC